MKKLLKILIFTLMVTMLAVGPALAQSGTIYLKGIVLSYTDGTLIVGANQGEFEVSVPDGLDVGFIEVGDIVLIKGSYGSSGLIEANFLEQAVGDNYDHQPEGSKDNSAYCSEDKQDQPHPLVASFAERYSVAEEEITQYFCSGYSMGAIVMALQTSDIAGVDYEWSELLALLAGGYSWNQIWGNMGLIENDQGGHSVAGLVTEPTPDPTEGAPEPTPDPTEEVVSSPTAAASEPEPTPTAVVSEPEPTPTAVVSEPEPTPTAVVIEPEPTPVAVIIEPEPTATAKPGKPKDDPSKTKVDIGDEDNNDQD